MTEQKLGAREFWVEHGKKVTGVRAVEPRISWLGYHAWSRRALQRWTIDRLRSERARYRVAVDLGCGNGEWTELIAPLCDELHACDLSPDFVSQVRSRTAWHRAVNAQVSDLAAFPIPKHADLVYIGAALMYLPDHEIGDLLRNIAARVEPGAHVVIRDYCTFNFGMRTEYKDRHSIHRSSADLVSLAERAGLSLVEHRSSFSIYGELAAGAVPGLQWPLRALARLVTIPWTRASHTMRFRA